MFPSEVVATATTSPKCQGAGVPRGRRGRQRPLRLTIGRFRGSRLHKDVCEQARKARPHQWANRAIRHGMTSVGLRPDPPGIPARRPVAARV